LEVSLSASGYLQAAAYSQGQEPYGHRLREDTAGSLHDHIINFKVDFDIAGTRNSLLDLSLEVEEREEPWFDDDWGTKVIQQKIVRNFIDNEDHSRLNYRANGQGVYSIVNREALNGWGIPRGYAIHPGASPVHLTNLNSKRTERNVEWAKQSLSVTRQKNSERYSSSLWNMNTPGKPTVDFAKFFDSESLNQEDLVAWINVGTHHIVRSEDSPHTLTNLATSSFLLSPFNYWDWDVSMESLNSIILNAPEPGQPWDVSTAVSCHSA
jgi:primary-amine oxidase